MRGSFIYGLYLFLSVPAVLPAQEQALARLTLKQALQEAVERSPVLRAQRTEVEEARARLVTARTPPFNPAVSVDAASRKAPDSRGGDRGLEVSQEVEIGGQRSRRIAVATADFEAAEARFSRNQRLLAGRVALAFADAVRARELLGIEEADATLAGDLLRFEERRLEAGASTQIDLNLARVATGRSARRLELARGAYAEARSALAEAVGLGPAAPPEPAGDLDDGTAQLPLLEELVRTALENREDLLASRREEEAARAQVLLERSLAIPNLVARVFQRREGGTEDIAGAGLSVGLPLFNRNRGSIAAARAVADRAAAQIAVTRLAVEREVASSLAVYRAASAAAEGLRGQVIGNLQENFRLLQRSFEEGKIGRSELFVFRREFVESQREYLDAVTEAWQARVRLGLATGRFPIANPSDRSLE